MARLLLPRDRNKTLTALAGAEPVVGAQHASVQRLQFFLSESTWDHEQVNARRVELLLVPRTPCGSTDDLAGNPTHFRNADFWSTWCSLG
ncbi:hypothetical protein [Streptomyces sp. NPDC048527]|uniref:hypothetical protein n=1 Tax=Streptomyces sp. NPDC048527 TaxID=3365568 RepID=UPI0037243C40